MDFNKKLQQEVDAYNQLVEEEHLAEKALVEVRERRHVAFGRVKFAEQLLQEDKLSNESVALSNGKSENVEVLEPDEH